MYFERVQVNQGEYIIQTRYIGGQFIKFPSFNGNIIHGFCKTSSIGDVGGKEEEMTKRYVVVVSKN